MSSIKESRLKDFLYEWIGLSKEQYDDAFYDQAAYLGIDMKIPRTAVVITSGRIRYSIIETIKSHLAAGEYIVRQGMEEVLILFRSDKRLESRLEKILDISKDLENCYIGESDVIASRTTNSVMQTFHIARALNIRKRILCYHEVSLECLLNNIEVTRELEEILKLLEERDIDVMFTDIRMPKMDGIEMLRVLREEGNHVSVIFLTAYSEFEYARNALKLLASIIY